MYKRQIKCSVPSGSNPYDFGSMRVIHNLHTEPAFNESAGSPGWSLKKWEGFKTTRRKKNGQPVQQAEEFEHVRWYLQHVDGHVITCQPKAWMDTGGVCHVHSDCIGAVVAEAADFVDRI